MAFIEALEPAPLHNRPNPRWPPQGRIQPSVLRFVQSVRSMRNSLRTDDDDEEEGMVKAGWS